MTIDKANADAKSLAEAARISPTTVFETPEDVVGDKHLTADEKSDILDQWQADAEALQTASDDGMPGEPPTDELEDVNEAKSKVERADAN